MERKTAASEEERSDKECLIYIALFPAGAYGEGLFCFYQP
jgi:hypothetical protein